jgi:hypothetical protein
MKVKEEQKVLMKTKVMIINNFFSQTIIKLTLFDIKDLVDRFLKKKILLFEHEVDK